MTNTIYTSPQFIQTKEYKRFEEFADTCEEFRYIGLCYGKPGVGKTFAAKYYAKWRSIEQAYSTEKLDDKTKVGLKECKAVFHTAEVTNTPKRISQEIYQKIFQFGNTVAKVEGKTELKDLLLGVERTCPLVIVDEADNLTHQSLEQLRGMYDKYGFGLVLIGMPGIEKRLSRYPQLYSRVGFAHQFRALSEDEMIFIFEKQWEALGLKLDKNQFADVEAIKTIARITNGNFRLIHRIFAQIQRLQKINNLQNISAELVLAARKCLVIG